MSHNNNKAKRNAEADDGGGGSLMPPQKKTKKNSTQIIEADRHFICPITLHYPIHPVVAGNGKIWEKSALEKYIQLNCPVGKTTVKYPTTGKDMSTTFIESPTIKNMIEDLINNESIKGELAETWTKVNNIIIRAKNGNVRAMHNICCKYGKGSDGFPQDHKESFLWAKKGHDAGYILGTYRLGAMMALGKGTDQNLVQGIMHVTQAAQGGHEIAAFCLGKVFAQGRYGVCVDKAEAIKWLKVSLSGECEFQRMAQKNKDDAQKLLDELLSSVAD